MKNSFLACLVCFLATTGAFALLSDPFGTQTALLTPAREVIYTTRAPLAEEVPETHQTGVATKEGDAQRVNKISSDEHE